MKEFHVFMYDLALIPLEQNPILRPAKIKEFDEKTVATEFAKSQRNNWDRVSVHKRGTETALVAFHGDDMYVGKKRTRLRESGGKSDAP